MQAIELCFRSGFNLGDFGENTKAQGQVVPAARKRIIDSPDEVSFYMFVLPHKPAVEEQFLGTASLIHHQPDRLAVQRAAEHAALERRRRVLEAPLEAPGLLLDLRQLVRGPRLRRP